MIQPGLYIQIYRGALSGNTYQDKIDHLKAYLQQIKDLGLPGVVLHGFPEEMVLHWDYLSQLATDAGLVSIPSWGLDAKVDNHGAPFTAEMKAALVGNVLVRHNCPAGILDSESLWDQPTMPGGELTESATIAFGKTLRKLSPNALVADQPWFAIEEHGDERAIPHPIDQGGTFRGFPSDEFAAYAVNWFRFRQMYCNDFSAQFGLKRYTKVTDWMDREWAVHTANLAKVGLDRPLGVTIQGYGWIMQDLAHCLLKYIGMLGQPVIMWSEPYPTKEAIAVIKGVRFLQQHGYVIAGVSPDAVVLAFQRDYNKLANVRITEDGKLGPITLLAMGIRVGI